MLLESFLEYSLDDVGDGNKLWSFLPVGEAVGTGEGHGHDLIF